MLNVVYTRFNSFCDFVHIFVNAENLTFNLIQVNITIR